MIKRYSIVFTLLAVCLLATARSAFAQDEDAETFVSVVKDADGNPVENAEVFSGDAYTTTDANGKFSIKIVPGTPSAPVS